MANFFFANFLTHCIMVMMMSRQIRLSLMGHCWLNSTRRRTFVPLKKYSKSFQEQEMSKFTDYFIDFK